MMPWGLGRMTVGGREEKSWYESVCLDPATQIAQFYDANGKALPIQMGATVTKSKGGGGDGAGTAAEVADDTDNDN
ncbi:putative ATP-grasp-modified RiPP [Nonomuraea fuscirosea]|jgi:putative ATP-grasp target RiPP|uniref:putative ATP-grasp-modified RiPP n=1 Tax=Nonomuraea fuscirosea TaxID=1291556 RepID=UPI003439944F